MEDIKKIQLNTEIAEDIYSINTLPRTRRNISKSRRKTRILNNSKLKRRGFLFNICISLLLSILLVSGYTDMVNISSDNLLIENKLSELNIELNSLENIALMNNSDKKIEKIAKTRLDMIYPTKNNIVELNKEKSNIAETKEIQSAKLDENIFSTIYNLFR